MDEVLLMSILFYFIYSIAALLIGSFLTTAAFRIPINQPLFQKRLECPSCKTKLHPIDMIPIVSYSIFRGKCRYCQNKISLIYPFGESLTLLIFLLIPLYFKNSYELIIVYTFIMLMISTTLSDIKYQIIPDKMTYSGFFLIFFLRLFIHPLPIWHYLLGSLLGGGFLFIIAFITKGGVGGGDIKLFFVIGLVLGWQNTLLALLFSTTIGAVVSGMLLIIGVVKRKQMIPFGPFIFIGTILTYFLDNV